MARVEKYYNPDIPMLNVATSILLNVHRGDKINWYIMRDWCARYSEAAWYDIQHAFLTSNNRSVEDWVCMWSGHLAFLGVPISDDELRERFSNALIRQLEIL
jgi:hypothetical protein